MTPPSQQDTPNSEYEVTLFEVFFDLVFVLAVSQFSQYLLTHLSWLGAAQTLVMLLAVLTVWAYTRWAATVIRADQLKTRKMLLAVMLLGLFMNASVTRAFTSSGWTFVVPLLLIQLGRSAWTILSSPDAVYREHYVRVFVWFSVTTPLWLAGAIVKPEARVLWWMVASGVELIGTWLAHPVPLRPFPSENVAFDADHMLERCRLFLIIALGETVLTTGTAISQTSLTPITLVTGTFAFVGTVALWALSFGRSHRLLLRHVEESSAPVRTSRHAVNVLMALVAGLIAVAVANQRVIAHPKGQTSVALSLLLFGGPILFLIAQGWYLKAMLHISPWLQLVGSAAMALAGCVAMGTSPSVALILAEACLALLALVDWRQEANRGVPVHCAAKVQAMRERQL